MDVLITERHPVALAIERTFLIQRESALLNVTATAIKYMAKQYGLAVYEYEPAKVRQTICQHGKATKSQTAQIIANHYPELMQFLKCQTKWERLYWAHMFDAVAVGLVCLREVYGDEKDDATSIF
jgi:Holliday junction resolvasome RuvABC endonuclease subunit